MAAKERLVADSTACALTRFRDKPLMSEHLDGDLAGGRIDPGATPEVCLYVCQVGQSVRLCREGFPCNVAPTLVPVARLISTAWELAAVAEVPAARHAAGSTDNTTALTVDGYHLLPPCAVGTPSSLSWRAMADHPAPASCAARIRDTSSAGTI